MKAERSKEKNLHAKAADRRLKLKALNLSQSHKVLREKTIILCDLPPGPLLSEAQDRGPTSRRPARRFPTPRLTGRLPARSAYSSERPEAAGSARDKKDILTADTRGHVGIKLGS